MPKIENHILAIGSHTDALPKLPRPAIVTVWTVPVEYRVNGYFVATRLPGEPEEVPACSQADTTLIGTLTLEPHPDAIRDAARAERMEMLNAETDRRMAALIVTYPECEIKSWPQQVKEAEALAADPLAATPLLSALATARGVPIADLASRVMQKSVSFAEASGQIIGARQALADRMAAAMTQDEVLAVPSL